MQRLTNSLSTKQRLGFVISRVFLVLQEPVLLVRLNGFDIMKQHKKDEIVLVIVGSVVLLTVLYYFVKAIIVLPN